MTNLPTVCVTDGSILCTTISTGDPTKKMLLWTSPLMGWVGWSSCMNLYITNSIREQRKKKHQMTCSQGYTLKKILLRTCPLTKWGGADGSTLYATISTRENTKICFQRTLSGRGKFFLETKTSTGEHKKCSLSDMSANDVGCRSFFIQPLRENKNNIFWSDYQLIFFLEGKETKKLGGAAWLKH